MARIIREGQPAFVFAENSPMLTSRGLDVVLGDLAAMGFDAEWGVLGAHRAGAPHKRDRIWVLARHPARKGKPAIAIHGETPGLQGLDASPAADWWSAEPPVGRVADGVAHRAHQLRAIGNGQVPACMAMAFRALYQRLMCQNVTVPQ